jgi:hypothetical protein
VSEHFGSSRVVSRGILHDVAAAIGSERFLREIKLTARRAGIASLTLLGSLMQGCGVGFDSSNASGPSFGLGPHYAELAALLQVRDYFALRPRLQGVSDRESPEALFFRASLQHAFNQPALSNATIDTLFEHDALPDSITLRLKQIKLNNYIRLHRYREALDVATAIFGEGDSASDSAILADIRNTARLLAVIERVPPQEARIRAQTTLPIDDAGHFDTGANFSVLMYSEATALGLMVKKVGLEVNTATGMTVVADVAIAHRVTMGNIEYSNVVFLVLPDETLSFPEHDLRIPGVSHGRDSPSWRDCDRGTGQPTSSCASQLGTPRA